MILAILVAASALLTGACRDSQSNPQAASAQTQTVRRPDPNPTDFDPTPDTPPALPEKK